MSDAEQNDLGYSYRYGDGEGPQRASAGAGTHTIHEGRVTDTDGRVAEEADEPWEGLGYPVDRNSVEHKPFMGGYRDTRNGVEYHHAYTQVSP
jgi:hypothetical protein